MTRTLPFRPGDLARLRLANDDPPGLQGQIVQVLGSERDRYGDGATVVDVLCGCLLLEVADYELEPIH